MSENEILKYWIRYSPFDVTSTTLTHKISQTTFHSNDPMTSPSVLVPSLLWHCWLGGRNGIRPVKNWVVECWHGYLSGARCGLAWPSWCHCHSLSLASVKSRLVLPFWCRLTRVVPGKGPLNGCVCVYDPMTVMHFDLCPWWSDLTYMLSRWTSNCLPF